MDTNSKPSTVLVVEDESLLLQAICKKINLKGMSAISATTGAQALDYLESLPELPDVIWLDYYLTDMTGLDFMNKLRAEPKWSNIPVIIVSNSATQEKVTSMLALGASKYILKADYRLEEIIGIISEITADLK